MTMRCTQSTCRREFTPGPTAPVRCPYCGHHYPRAAAGTGVGSVPFGYGLRIEARGHTAAQIRQLILREVPVTRAASLWAIDFGQPFLIDLEASLGEAQTLCRRLCALGIGAQVTAGRHMTRSTLPVLRPRFRR